MKYEVLFNSYEKETKRQNSASNITASLPAELKYRVFYVYGSVHR